MKAFFPVSARRKKHALTKAGKYSNSEQVDLVGMWSANQINFFALPENTPETSGHEETLSLGVRTKNSSATAKWSSHFE